MKGVETLINMLQHQETLLTNKKNFSLLPTSCYRGTRQSRINGARPQAQTNLPRVGRVNGPWFSLNLTVLLQVPWPLGCEHYQITTCVALYCVGFLLSVPHSKHFVSQHLLFSTQTSDASNMARFGEITCSFKGSITRHDVFRVSIVLGFLSACFCPGNQQPTAETELAKQMTVPRLVPPAGCEFSVKSTHSPLSGGTMNTMRQGDGTRFSLSLLIETITFAQRR